MTDIPFGYSSEERARGDLPQLPVINMLAELSKSSEKGLVLQSRPGLEENSTAGTGAVRGIFKQDGVFSGAVFTVTDTSLYRDGVLVGAIDGAGAVSFSATGDDDGYDDQLVLTSGASAWFYDGALSAIVFPDAANVIKVAYLSGYFIFLKENSQRWYFSAVNDGSSVDGLDFASAENEPDRLIDIIILNDMVVFLGSETTEFWQKTGDADLPFAPVTGRVFNKGCKQTGAASYLDNSGAWVSNSNIVYHLGEEATPIRVSDNSLEEQIGDSATVQVFTFFWEGHEVLAIRLDDSTKLYDVSTRQLSEFKSYGKTNWLPQCATAGPLFGSSEGGQILQFGAGHDDLAGPLERRFRGGTPINGGALTVNNLRVRVNAGQTPYLAGDYADPIAELRISRDAGQTFGDWRSAAAGVQGVYNKRVEWRALGQAHQPGFLFEIRCTDPIPFTVSGVELNPALGGRA